MILPLVVNVRRVGLVRRRTRRVWRREGRVCDDGDVSWVPLGMLIVWKGPLGASPAALRRGGQIKDEHRWIQAPNPPMILRLVSPVRWMRPVEPAARPRPRTRPYPTHGENKRQDHRWIHVQRLQ